MKSVTIGTIIVENVLQFIIKFALFSTSPDVLKTQENIW